MGVRASNYKFWEEAKKYMTICTLHRLIYSHSKPMGLGIFNIFSLEYEEVKHRE